MIPSSVVKCFETWYNVCSCISVLLLIFKVVWLQGAENPDIDTTLQENMVVPSRFSVIIFLHKYLHTFFTQTQMCCQSSHLFLLD